jgi:hypothetical protein
MPRVAQFAVALADEPGAFAGLCSTLGKTGVNVSADPEQLLLNGDRL